MLCTVGWCLTVVLSIFSREVGSLEGGRLGASQVGSACCIWTYLPSGSLIGNGGRYFCTFICEGRLSFGSRKVVALASSSYTGVRVAVWLSASHSSLRLLSHWSSASRINPSSSGCLFALRFVLLQVLKLGFLMLSPQSPSFCSEGVVTNRCIVTLVGRLTRMTVQSPRLGEYRQCGKALAALEGCRRRFSGLFISDGDPAFRRLCSVARETTIHSLWYGGHSTQRSLPDVSPTQRSPAESSSGIGVQDYRMGSSYRSKSTHMVDIKGKGILYEDDDEPIKLTDHDTSKNIDEFKLSLIGKILNPKKQSVEKLLQKMPVQWGMGERITANDLGNGKFLLNFSTEEELASVLRQGPFHFNFCMFVLVRWEPIVHDDYPWIVPFWTRLIGVPLHLWTENNLREIGSRLGHVHQDTIELIEGRMLLDIDSRRPLKFARKAESPEGDEVTIEIKYEMLFKHCSTCGMLTHEKEYCPSLQRQGVFARVQTQENRLPMSSHALGKKDTNASHLNNAAVRFDSGARTYRLDLPREAYKRHDDRIIRRRDEQPGRKRYGGARQEAKPYDRYNGARWREKKPQAQTRHDRVEVREEIVVRDRLEWKSPGRPDGSYGHQMRVASPLPRESAKSMQADRVASALQSQAPMLDEQRSVGVPKRIASAIVTPSRGVNSDGNVTKRFKGTPRSLAFETLTQQDPKPATEDEQVIEALNDMDITEQLDGGMMDCEMQNDDLMGLELAEMEEKSGHERADHGAEQISQKPSEEIIFVSFSSGA
ncbi:hypothetical protein HID58_006488 [Brassica napus]|uniref:DUF4283 domain-containing protein n=2 Tax=Brassica TaxID=3705 RepID=A0ABQ8EBJ0_BRANA|nr:hypothetical protein HID58_006488 [Brassica napus]